MASTMKGLVACSDLTGYAKLAARKSDEENFQLLSAYYEFVGDKADMASTSYISSNQPRRD